MPDQIHDQLGAYLDGELGGRRLMEVQTHLETYPDCRAELDSLRDLSGLLHASPDPEFTPARLFTSRLMLQLPRRHQTRASGNSFLYIKGMTPVLLLLSWIFIQVTASLSTLITLAGRIGLLGNSAEWLPGAPQQTLWFTSTQAFFGGFMNLQGAITLSFLNDLVLWFQNLDGAFLLQAVLVVLYFTWLVIWLKNRQPRHSERLQME
jgi:hypothetical protein